MTGGADPPARRPRLSAEHAQRISFTERQLVELVTHESPTVLAWFARIADRERQHGDHNGVLQPRDLAGAAPELRSIMRAVYDVVGERALELSEIDQVLPEVLSRLACREGRRRAAQRGLYTELSEDVLQRLATEYARDVSRSGAQSPSTFWKARHLMHEQGQVLVAVVPAFFPKPEERRAKTELPSGGDLSRLERIWKSEVLARKITVSEFEAREDLPTGTGKRLCRELPDRFHALTVRQRLTATSVDAATVQRIADAVTLVFTRDPLATIEDAVTELNRDPKLVALAGMLSPVRYYNLDAKFPGVLPRPASAKAKQEAVQAELTQLVEGRGLSFAEATDELRQRHPKLRTWRLTELRAELGSRTARTSPTDHGSFSIRSTEPVLAAYRLAMLLAPPGLGWDAVAGAAHVLIEARGVRPVKVSEVNRIAVYAGGPNFEERQAAKAAAVVAEYARAAKNGADERDILAQVMADYPHLDKFHITAYTKLWAAEPAKYPELTPFLKRRTVHLVGLGERLENPIYQGGWEPMRACFGGHADDVERAVDLVQQTRIPLSLPMLDELVAELQGKKPLDKKNILWVSHILATTFPLVRALQQVGAWSRGVTLVGTPYGSNSAVVAAVKAEGVDVRVPKLASESYLREVKQAIDDVVARHRENHQPIVVMDDGGLVAKILHENPKYAWVLPNVRIVEQTTRGITEAERHELRVPVVNVAKSKSKQFEAVGRAVSAKLLQALRRNGSELEGARVAVLGYGMVGRQLAHALKQAGAIVTVVEPGEANRKVAASLYEVASKPKALATADIVVGATGVESLTCEDIERYCKKSVTLASATSKRLEFAMADIERRAKSVRRIEPESPVVRLPTRTYELSGKTVTVIGDGWPINFDGDLEDIPQSEIQLTRCLMLLGVIQAASMDTFRKTGVIPLDPDVDDNLAKRYQRRMKGQKPEPIGDPKDWDAPIKLLQELFSTHTEARATHGNDPLRRRVKLGDRALAQQVAAQWEQHLGCANNEDRVRAILGDESLTIAEIRMLRQANERLLGPLFHVGRFTPNVVAAVAALVNADPTRSLDAVAADCSTHLLLKTVTTRWTRAMVKYQIEKHPRLFQR